MPRTLVADDSDSMRQMLIMMLKKAGITDIIQANDGDKAIEIAKSDKIGLMLLDYVMPTVGGLDVLKAIRSDINTKDLPIILITANADMDVITIAQKPETFANAIIVKPLSFKTFSEKISFVMNSIKTSD